MIYTLPFRTNVPHSFTSHAGNNNFRFHIKYCIADDSYFMDIDIMKNGSYVPLISCLSITCGCDLFTQFTQYGLGTMFILPLDTRYFNEIPHSDTLVSKFVMIWEHD